MTINPNWFAYLVLFSWPLVTLSLYRRMPLVPATLWSITGAYLLLPAGASVDLPMVPPLDKVTVSNIAAFFVCRFILGKRVPVLPRTGKARTLMLLYIVSPFFTALLNDDPVFAGPRLIAAMNSYDALSNVIRQLLFILPFLLGLQFFRSHQAMENMLSVLVVAGLWYSLPMLLEIRLSPQLHRWIYGYFPHSFVQQMRDGGFRPVVFIGHGLWVAFFTMTAVTAAAVLWRLRQPVKSFSAGAVTAYLAIVLLLCKSMASFLYAGFAVALVYLSKPKSQAWMAKVLVVIALSYPLTRGLGWFPVQTITDTAAVFSEQRAQSFDFRMDNEERLLDKANQKPWFGWGTWGRNRVYDKKYGRDISVTDGRWIQVIGQFGWVGFIAEFGLLTLPVFVGARVIRQLSDRREALVFAALILLQAISVLDLLPNNSMSPWTWLLAGALLGRSAQIVLEKKKEV